MHFYAILVIFSVLKSVISAVEPHKFGRFYEIVIPEYGTVSGEVEKINIMYGESVYQLMNSLCGSLIKKDMCSLYADTISQHIYYWAWYTPSRNSSTVEDFSSARFDIINHIKSEYNAKKYLEMGCERGETFTRINQDMDIAYCIDPDIGGTHKMTSDNFFSNNNITFDLIFVDGMHEAHQVLRDVQNSLRWLKYDGHIVLHDCNPQREYEQRIPRPQLGLYILFLFCYFYSRSLLKQIIFGTVMFGKQQLR